MTSARRKWTPEERLEAVRPLLDVHGSRRRRRYGYGLTARAAEVGVSARTLRRWLVFHEEQNAGPRGVPQAPQSAPRPAPVTPIDSVSLPQTLAQDFLVELWFAKREAAILRRRYRQMLDHAVKAIRAGAEIEPGIHELHVKEICDKRGRKFIRAIIL